MSSSRNRSGAAVDPVAETDHEVDITATGVDGRARAAGVAPARGDRIGRFIVIAPLGKGGMGVVLKAYDPDLDRKVAIKLLHARASDDADAAQARLLREAQAVARLAHPHVVTVYEVGVENEQLYMAMELVEGATLSGWCALAPRTSREILAMFLAAGRGLAAAHALGIVHRDFKPSNVVVGDDGRARVLDFGLARAAGADSVETPPPGAAKLPWPELTQTGAIVGTPAYMAPEQHRGEEATARSDQFSFCVALYEALYRRHPFYEQGDSIEDLAASVTGGRLRPPPRGAGPGRLRRALARGLAIDPQARHPSMAALLAELGRQPLFSPGRAVAAVAVLGLAGWAVAATVRPGPSSSPCANAGARLAGVWDPPARAALRRSLAGSGVRGADVAATELERLLDRYAASWTAAATEACAATRVRGEESELLLDRRMQCLGDSLHAVGAMTAELTRAPDRGHVARAVNAASDLTQLEDCADPKALAARYPPAPASSRARVEALRERLSEARASYALAQDRSLLPAIRVIALDASVLGYPPILAQTLSWQAFIEDKVSDPSAEATLRAAVRAAAAARDDQLLAKLSVRMLRTIGVVATRTAEAWNLVPLIEANVQRSGGVRERAFFEHMMCALANQSGNLPEALAHGERAIALYAEAFGPDDVDIGFVERDMGDVLRQQGLSAEARPHLERSVALLERELGKEHRDVAVALYTLGSVEYNVTDHAAARRHLERAVAIEERMNEPAQVAISDTRLRLGEVLLAQGETAAAERMLAGVLAAREAGHDDYSLGGALIDVGEIFRLRGDLDTAERYNERAWEALRRTQGRARGVGGTAIFNLGEIRRAQGRCQEAIGRYQEARAVWAEQWGAEHSNVAYADTGVGLCQLDLRRPQAALAPLEAALALRRKTAQAPDLVGESAFALARALAGAGKDAARARALAQEARTLYAGLGGPGVAQVKAIDAWLSEPGTPR